jgi:hypothetical protein
MALGNLSLSCYAHISDIGAYEYPFILNASSRVHLSFLLFLASPVCVQVTCWVLCKGINIFLSFKHVQKNTGSTIF